MGRGRAAGSVVLLVFACGRSPSAGSTGSELACHGNEHRAVRGASDPKAIASATGSCLLELDHVTLAGVTCGDGARVVVRDSNLVADGYVIHASQSCSVQLERGRVVSRDNGMALFLNDASTMTVAGTEIVGQIGGQHDYLARLKGLDSARWSAPGEAELQVMTASRCLGTAGLRAEQALAWRRRWKEQGRPAAGSAAAPALHPDSVQGCADQMAMAGRPPTEVAPLARRWAAAIVPTAARYHQERGFVAQGDERADPQRGAAIGAEIDRADAELPAATNQLRAAIAGKRAAAQKAWLAQSASANQLATAVHALILAADDLAFVAGDRAADPGPFLEAAAARCSALDDLLAAHPELRRTVDSWWAEESGNATTWAALEAALGELCAHGKRLRRRLLDERAAPTPDDLAGFGARYEQVIDHFWRLRFN